MITRGLLPGVLALALASAACGHGAGPGAPEALPALDRVGLDSLTGRQWPGDRPPLANTQRELGWLIQGGDTASVFGVEVLLSGNRRLVLFSRQVGRSGQNPVWQILDAGWLPPLSGSIRVVSRCRRGHIEEQELFAIARVSSAEELTDVQASWRANITTRQIEPVNKDGVRCANPGGA